ncbi:MAG: hypothetical protein ACI4B3_00585 [Prevotella sp.]
MTSEQYKTIRFETAESYFATNSTGDKFIFRVVKRTNKKIMLRDKSYGKLVKVGIYSNDQGVEFCYPMGKRVSRPILLASNRIEDE